MNQADTAESPRVEIDQVSGPAPLPWRDVILAVLPMGIMAAYALAIFVVNRLVPFFPATSRLEMVLREYLLGSAGRILSQPVLYWSPALGVIGVGLPLGIAGFKLIRRQPIPIWLLPALGIAFVLPLMTYRFSLALPISITVWLTFIIWAVISLIVLHRAHPLPLAVWGSLVVIFLLEWHVAASAQGMWNSPAPLRAMFGNISLPPVLSVLVAASVWLGRTHRQHSLLIVFAPMIVLVDYILFNTPAGLNDHLERGALSSDPLVWVALYLLWGAFMVAMMMARRPIVSARIGLLALPLLAILLLVIFPPLPQEPRINPDIRFAYSDADTSRLIPLGAALLASALAIMAVSDPPGPVGPLDANPFYRLVTSQRQRPMSRASRVYMFRIIAAVGWIGFFLMSGIYICGSQVIGPDAASVIPMAMVVALIVGLTGLLLVSQVLIPTFLALATVRRLIPLLSSEMFTLAQITNQSAEQITSGLDAAMHKRLRVALIGYGVLLMLIPRIDLLSLFHRVDGNTNIEAAVALRIGLFGMALVGIRLGMLFALIRRDLTEGQLAAGFAVLIGTLFLIAVPLPPVNSGLPYIAGLILIAFSPYVIADRVMQATNWLLDRRAQEVKPT